MTRRIEIAPLWDSIWWSRLDDDPDQVIQMRWSRLDDDLVVMMIQTRWWSRSSDPDVMMIQTWWRSRSSDDPTMMSQYSLWYISRDEEYLKTQKNWRWKGIEEKEDLNTKEDLKMTRWSSWCREEHQCWKLCRKNTFLVKRECWCICNFGMYSSMYLIYCNSMFILWCIYYVIESCRHPWCFDRENQ